MYLFWLKTPPKKNPHPNPPAVGRFFRHEMPEKISRRIFFRFYEYLFIALNVQKIERKNLNTLQIIQILSSMLRGMIECLCPPGLTVNIIKSWES